jgi:hypothetical protein
VVNRHAVQLFPPGVVSATLSGPKYSSSLLDNSDGLNHDCPGSEAMTQGRRSLLGKLSGLLTGTP